MLAPVLFSSNGQLCPEMSRDVSSGKDRCCVPLAWLSPASGPEEHLLILQPMGAGYGGLWPWLSHLGMGEAEATGNGHVSQT